MRLTFPKLAVLLHLAFVFAYLACGRGGSRPSLYLPLLWLLPGLIEMVVLFPPKRREETDEAARARAMRAIWHDPVLLVGLALLAFLTVQFLNGPRPLLYDATAGAWRHAPAPLPFLPSCLNRAEAGQALYWFGTAWVTVLAVRHGLSRRSRLALAKVWTGIAALLALLGLAQIAGGASRIAWSFPAPSPFFATFGYLNHAGAFFTLTFLVSAGLFVQYLGENAGKRRPAAWWYAACMILNLMGATFSLSRAAILFSWLALLVGLVVALRYLQARQGGGDQLRSIMAVFIALAVSAFLFFVAYPGNRVDRSLRSLRSLDRIRAALVADRVVLARASLAIWRQHPLAGVGLWGFRREAGLHLTPEQWPRVRSPQPAVVHNDLLQFLCELGAIGLLMLLAAPVLLIRPLLARWRAETRAARAGKDNPETRAALMQRIPPAAWGTMLGLASTLVFGLIDMPFRNPLILMTWCGLLAILPALLPKAGDTLSTPVRPPPQRRSADADDDDDDGEAKRVGPRHGRRKDRKQR